MKASARTGKRNVIFCLLVSTPSLGSRPTDAETASAAAIGRNRERRSRRSVPGGFLIATEFWTEIMAKVYFLQSLFMRRCQF
jgi:hypothetical protein